MINNIYNSFDSIRDLLDEEKEKQTDSQRFVSLVRRSGGEKIGNALRYAEENKKLIQMFADNQKLTEIVYERAEAVLNGVLEEDEKKFPLPVREIAKRLGFDIIERNFQDDEDENGLNRGQNLVGRSTIARMQMREKAVGEDSGSIAGTIFVRKNLDENSKRFGIAHELGHFVLRTVNPIGLLYIEEACPGMYAFVMQREFLANEFAYALLMPLKMVCVEKHDYESHSVNLPIDYSNWILHLRDLAQFPEYHVVLAYEKIKLLSMYYQSQEIEDLGFYTGAITTVGNDTETIAEPFRNPKGYEMFNSFFYDGTGSEEARLDEGRKLEEQLFDDPQRIARVARSLLALAWKNTASDDMVTYRIERKANFDEVQTKKRTVSFTSTSQKGFLSEYENKKDLILLTYHIPAGTPCIDVSAVLGNDYMDSEEREILLPPFLSLDIQRRPLTEKEQNIRDSDRKAPVAAYEIMVGEPMDAPERNIEWSFLDETRCEESKQAVLALENTEKLSLDDKKAYRKWKNSFIQYVWKKNQEFKKIRSSRS